MPRIILPVPHYPQEEAGECLAICALMVLRYLGVAISLDQLRRLLQIDWFGTPFSKIEDLTQLKVNVEFGEGELGQLWQALDNRIPPLVAVDTSELSYANFDAKHTVVLIGRTTNAVYLHDPMVTTHVPIKVPENEFMLAWMAHDQLFATLTKVQ